MDIKRTPVEIAEKRETLEARLQVLNKDTSEEGQLQRRYVIGQINLLIWLGGGN